jgi:hypothetical protein
MNGISRADVGFVLVTSILILISHAVALFVHEFAHSFLAWSLGFMSNPLALDYGSASPGNVLLQIEVGDNVDYAPILAGGHGFSAAAIALAGAFVGNGVVYCATYAVLRSRASELPAALADFLFWLGLMCAGNIWSYVPMRALANHADIATAARGLDLSGLALFPFLLIPALLIVFHFFHRTCRLMIPILSGARPDQRVVVIALVATWFFLFFGGVGLSGSYGAISQAFAIISDVLLLPASIMWLLRFNPVATLAERQP